jgi:hypothetical protein
MWPATAWAVVTAKEGDVLGIGLRHSVREYNGRYYGETHISEFEQVQPF